MCELQSFVACLAALAVAWLCCHVVRRYGKWFAYPYREPFQEPEQLGAYSGIDEGDVHFQRMVMKFQSRGDLWLSLSRFTLIGAAVLIAVGMIIFLAGPSLVNIGDGEEAELLAREKELRSRESQLVMSVADIRSNAELQSGVRDLVLAIKWLVDDAKRVVSGNENADRFSQNLAHCTVLIETLAANEPPISAVRFDELPQFAGWKNDALNGNRISFEPEIILEVTKLFESSRLDVGVVEEFLKGVAEGRHIDLRSVDLQAALGAVSNAWDKAKSAAEQAANAAGAAEIDAPETERQRAEAAQERELIREELSQIRESRDQIRLLAWIPSISIRIGAVILLLYLTRVFVETYRYTLSIASYYYARADAIQMVDRGKGKGISAAKFSEMIQAVSPSDLKIDRIESAESYIAQMLAEIARIRGAAP